MNTENVMYALEIMGKGMLSIFIVVLILTLIVVLLGKITNSKFFKKNEDEAED
jgi:Na+-transporting methylmalonyl-CoA/oxaloacetate decarboxylase gamma subunit